MLAALFEELVVRLQLHVMQTPQWQLFPGAGGITGLCLLAESHLTVHTFPETGFAALNVYCCRPRAQPDFSALLGRLLGASQVRVRQLERGVSS